MSIWTTPTTDEQLDKVRLAEEVEFIGQQHIKTQIEPFLNGATMPHVLLTGDPGLGKTQFGRWVAYRRQEPFFEKLAPVRADYLPPYGVLLLDEVHRQTNVEALFPAMEKGLLAVIAATTKPEKLDSAFRSRFLLSFTLKPYTDDSISKIMDLMAGRTIENSVLAKAARGNPRVAERIVRTAQSLGTWDVATVLQAVQITADGLSDIHFDYLNTLRESHRPLGIDQIKAMSTTGADRVQTAERTLISMRFVELRPEGRRLTPKGEAYIAMLEQEGVL